MNTTTSVRATNGILNGLIVACGDDVRVQGAAARAAGGESRLKLEDATRVRGEFINELSQLVRDGGGTATDGGSTFEAAAVMFASMRSLVIGNHPGDRYSACARVEGKTLALYERALEGRLPDKVRSVLERQVEQIASDHEEWRRRRIV